MWTGINKKILAKANISENMTSPVKHWILILINKLKIHTFSSRYPITRKPFPPSICSCIATELFSSSTRNPSRVALQQTNISPMITLIYTRFILGCEWEDEMVNTLLNVFIRNFFFLMKTYKKTEDNRGWLPDTLTSHRRSRTSYSQRGFNIICQFFFCIEEK